MSYIQASTFEVMTMNEPLSVSSARKRTRMVRPYPTHTLEDALGIAAAIQEVNAGLPFDRKLLARALGTTPASSGYTMRLNSASKYGLTQGAYNDEQISLTPRGEAIVAPRDEAERRDALIEAAMEPDIFGRFYRMLDGKRLPEDAYAQNMLQREFGVHPELAAECLGIIKTNGLYVGILSSENGALRVGLRERNGPASGGLVKPVLSAPSSTGVGRADALATGPAPAAVEERELPPAAPATRRANGALAAGATAEGAPGRIFIGHSGSADAVAFVLEILDQFGIPHGSADVDEQGGQPVPMAMSSEMRKCSAAILVFGDPGAPGRMLYQLGAASVLYGDRVVILRDCGVELGRELAGLRSVEYRPDAVKESGLELLKALHASGIIKVSS
ncbi:MAG: nucleotide-binding protein [Chloroflexi bacterium]|nr:nucleotide-binding protein [Chloroflexota bacterium]